MKQILTKLLLLFVFTAYTFSAPVPEHFKLQNKNYEIAYTIEMPERFIGGKHYPVYTHKVELLPQENLHQNIFEIKTHSHQVIDDITGRFYNSNLQKSLDDINMVSARAPYAGFFSGNNLLKNDVFGVSRIYEIRFEGNHDPYEICQIMMKHPDVEYATPVFKRFQYYTPNDPRYVNQYHLNRIQIADAWDITKGDTNIVIAIIDSGTDITHEDLAGNIWTNPKEIPGNGKDDDGNGKIDDVNGWDFIGNISTQQYQAGQFQENNNPTAKLNTHGTHTAGCAAAVTDNSKGVAAPGFNCRIMPIKCASDAFQSPGILRGYEAILYAAVTGAHVINCSWGGPGSSPTERDIVNQAINLGSLIVAASGNTGKNLDLSPDYPAAFPGVLSVGSSNAQDRASGFASYGNLVRVFAPGENIWSTLPNNRYEAQTGTSMSSPVVAGVAALLLSIHKDWTPEQVIMQLRGTCDNVLQPTNASLRPYYFGRINAAKALQINNQPGQIMPGISLMSVRTGLNNFISNYDNNELTLRLKNILASDKNVKVRLIPIDDFIDFEQSVFEISEFNSMEEKEIKANAKLLSNNPWFNGDAEILIEITGTNFINLEVARINIVLESENVFTNYATYPSQYGIQWHDGSVVNNNTFFVVGVAAGNQSGIALKSNGPSRNFIQISTQPVYSIHAFDEENLIVGDGPSNGNAQVHISTNGGQNWTRRPVANITSFINAFHFFNENEGLMLGDPVAGAWGVGYTNNKGINWMAVANIPPPIGTETGLVGSVYQKGDTVWFGTTLGRVFRTTNKGTSWLVSTVQASGFVTGLSFSDSIGVCLYRESSAQGSPAHLAVSKDGGMTWQQRVYNFTINNQTPLNIYAIQGSKTIVTQLFTGQILASDTEGTSWYPVLNRKRDNYMYALANQNRGLVSMFAAGFTEVNRLDFSNSPVTDEIKELSFVAGSTLDFDNVDVDATKTLTKDVRNIGNTVVDITKVEFVPADGTEGTDFTVLQPTPRTISTTQPSQFRVRFQPKSAGQKAGQVLIHSDAVNSPIVLNVTGIGNPVSSVNTELNSEILSLNPNPANDKIRISFGELSTINKIEIYDIIGNKIIVLENYISNNDIDISNLSSGTYFIKLYSGNKLINGQFVIQR